MAVMERLNLRRRARTGRLRGDLHMTSLRPQASGLSWQLAHAERRHSVALQAYFTDSQDTPT
jgi:hypothetical protein